MYKSLISAVVLAGFGVSNFSSSLVFAKEDESEPLIKKSKKTKEKGSNLDISEKPGSLINKKRKKSVTGKQKSGETNEKTKFIIDALSKINLYKILLPICLPTASFMIARHFLNKGQWSESVKDVEVSATENAKEKVITEKDTDSGNSIKQPNQKTLEQPEVNNKDLNKEVGNIDSKDSKVTYKAGFAVVGFVILAVIIYNYLNRAIIEEKQENGTSTYKVNLNKASKEQLEMLRNKLKVGDKILLNFKVLQNNRDEFLRKINVFLKGNNNNNKMLPILDYEKCEDDLMGILETRKDTIGQTKGLSFKVLDDYSGTIISLKEKLEKSENLDIFEKNLNLINNGFGQIYTETSDTGVSTFGEILKLAEGSSLIDFTYLRVEKEKLDSAFYNFAMNNVEGWEGQLGLCQITGATGLLYRDILEVVEKNRKNRRDVNNSTASSYKKISTAPSAKDLLDFIDVMNGLYSQHKDFLYLKDNSKLKETNNYVKKNLIYTNLLKKFIIYILSNGNTVAKRELYRSEKYELFALFKEACAIEENISFKMKDEEIKKLLVGLENDDKQPGLLNLLKNFLERFKDNTIKEQAPARFDAITIEELAKIYNEDYIKNRLDVFSGEFWELFKYVNNKNNEKNVGNIDDRDENLFKLISNLEDKLIGDNNVELIIEKIYNGEFFKYLYYDDTVGEIYFNIGNNKIPLKDFVAAVEKTDVLRQIFLEDEEYYKYKNVLHPLFLLLDVEAQKKDLIALAKGENYLGSITHQFNSVVKNPNLEKKVKNHFLKNADKFSKYHRRYDENLEKVKKEAEKLKLQEGSKEYNNYLLENVFKNRKHKLPERLDNISVDEFIKTYEKYYIDDDLDVLSQEFWDIFIYVQDKMDEQMKVENKDKRQKCHLLNISGKLLNKILENSQLFQEEILKIFLQRDFAAVSFNEENNKIEIKIQNVKIPFERFCEVAGIIIEYEKYLNDKDRRNTFFTAELLKLISHNKQNKRFYIVFTESEKKETFEAYLRNDFEEFFGEYKNLSKDLKEFFEKQREEYLRLFALYEKNKEKVEGDLIKKGVKKHSNEYYSKILENVFKDEKENIENKEIKAENEIKTNENQT